MQDISIYFLPVNEGVQGSGSLNSDVIKHSEGNFPETLKKGSVALFYVPEFRNGDLIAKPDADKFRKHFYDLHTGHDWSQTVYDLGTIMPGKTVEDTYFAVGKVVAELVKKEVIPVVVGGDQSLTMALYNGYEHLEQLVNVCAVDAKLDMGDPTTDDVQVGYVSQMLLKRPCYLFNFSTIGVQAPLVQASEFDLFEKLYFDYCRLGEFNADFKRAEPHLRNSDILSIDLTSVRYSELVDPQYVLSNGFYADQLCQIAKYAGISDKLTSFGLFNYYPEQSTAQNVSNLVAQVLWYFIDGVNARRGDFPIGSKKDYFRFTVHLDDFKDELVFYKSNKSERWWMEVPYPAEGGRKYERHHLVPCDQSDYDLAMKNEVPNLWWKTYQKLS